MQILNLPSIEETFTLAQIKDSLRGETNAHENRRQVIYGWQNDTHQIANFSPTLFSRYALLPYLPYQQALRLTASTQISRHFVNE